ncbi:N-acetylmuramidase domain-containing protein [Hahella ganghwensis]|uniref:N-acetylmuramidase domain-containing protein n=1 Tax=Hahella ganghwensis TaxID=286420 RepID=UPI000376CC79|nr:N-acetylmuramidase domain-containing protein [Hahella ganghwensis]
MMGSITATLLNVRDQPNVHGRVLGELVKGMVIEVYGQQHGWFEIQFQGRPAFIYGDYVQVDPQKQRQVGVVSADLLNVRSRPSLDGLIKGKLAKGAVVEVVSVMSGWLEISYQGEIGYCSSTYVQLHQQESRRHGMVTASLLNVRLRPGKDAPVLGQLTGESRVVIESSLGDWYKIVFNNDKGYVASEYVRVLPEADDGTSIPIAANDPGEPVPPEVNSHPTENSNGLLPDYQIPVAGSSEERSVAATWNQYGGLLSSLSREKQFDVACSVAVLCVESSGNGFDSENDQRMVIRFENHKFWKYWGRTDPEQFRQHFTYDSDQVWKGHKWRQSPDSPWQSFHGIQRSEWEVLDFARSIDNTAALLSISMGAPQIMGFNYEGIGFQSVQEMFKAFSEGIGAQITGMFEFMSPAMIRFLQQRDFTGFAGLYNGSGQKEVYGRRIKNHYDAFKRIA